MKIRLRYRRGYTREAGRYTEWSEWQVVDGRRVVARFDFEEQAKQFIQQKTADKTAEQP